MTRIALLTVAAFLACGIGFNAHAKKAATEDVIVESNKSVAEMGEYVEVIDSRVQRGRYDVITEKERKWVIQNIARMRKALEGADVNAAPSDKLKALASEFETGIIKIEEGGIICRQERRTGSSMVKQRCFTRKRLEEDTLKSQEQMRNLVRPSAMPIGPGGG